MNKKRTWIIFLIVLLLLALNKWRPWEKKQMETSGRGRSGASVTNVRAHLIEPRDIENEITATGSILADESVTLTNEISGRVTAIYFKEGRHVKKGELLLQLYDADLQAQRERAEAQLKLAVDIEARQKKQLDMEAISLEEYETALNRLHTAKADVQLIQAQIIKSRITAPFDGIIGLRYVSEGAYLSPGVRIATLIALNPIKIDFAVPERFYALLADDLPIRFRIQGLADEYSGKIYAVEPEIDTDIRSVRCRAVCPNPDGLIKPGAFAEVTIPLKKLAGALMIPSEALIPDAQKQSVFVVKNNKVQTRNVVTGLRTSETVQILSGLSAGDTVLTTGLLQVRPGSAVRVTELN